eukprot:3252432-Rhodomonas_salina.1
MGKLSEIVSDKVFSDFVKLHDLIKDTIDFLKEEDPYRGQREQIADMERDLGYVGEVLESLEGGASLSFEEGMDLEEVCGQLEEKYKDWKLE